MIRARIRSIQDHDRIAEPAIARGHCLTRAEVRSCRALSRLVNRGRGQYRDQQGRKAWAALPKAGPGALRYLLDVISPNLDRRWVRSVRIHGYPGAGSPND